MEQMTWSKREVAVPWLTRLLAALTFGLLLIPPLAFMLGVCPTPANLSPGVPRFACAWLLVAWLVANLPIANEPGAQPMNTVEHRLAVFAVGGVMLGAVLMGTAVYFISAFSGGTAWAALSIAVFFAVAFTLGCLGDVIATGSTVVVAAGMLQVYGIIGMPIWILANGSHGVFARMSDSAGVALFCGMFVVVAAALPLTFRFNRWVARRRLALGTAAALCALAYLAIVWAYWLSGWQVLWQP